VSFCLNQPQEVTNGTVKSHWSKTHLMQLSNIQYNIQVLEIVNISFTFSIEENSSIILQIKKKKKIQFIVEL